MANITVMNSIYQRLGFTVEASNLLSRAQGMNGIDDLSLLTDTEVDTLCKLVCLPGGMLLNPAGRAGAQMSAPGCAISMRAIMNLKLACYCVHHQTRTSRICTPVNVTVVRVRELCALRPRRPIIQL